LEWQRIEPKSDVRTNVVHINPEGTEPWSISLAQNLSATLKSWTGGTVGADDARCPWCHAMYAAARRRAKQIDRIEKKLGREAANIARDRLMLQAIGCDNECDLERDAAEFNLEKEKYRLLKTFQDECLLERFDVDFVEQGYIEDLKQFDREIREMGQIFESLGLAKPRKGLSWVPRQKLHDIIVERNSPTPQKFDVSTEEGVHKLNLVIIRAYLEVADVAAFIVTVMSAVGVNTGRDGGWKANPALRELLVSTSVRGRFEAAASTSFLVPNLHVIG
jgi:hypothetical protein